MVRTSGRKVQPRKERTLDMVRHCRAQACAGPSQGSVTANTIASLMFHSNPDDIAGGKQDHR